MLQETAAIPSDEPETLNRRVFALAWPVIGENLLETLLGVVDTWLVAGLGTVALAGVGSGLQIMFFLMAALSALSVGSSILVAQAVGAKDLDRASGLARQSLVWSVLLSIPLALFGFVLARPIMGVFGLAPEVERIGVAVLRVTVGTVVVLVALIIGSGALRGAGDSKTPLRVTAIANIVNLALAYGLIYGHLGLPRLGAVGSAWATFIARGLALLLLLHALWKGRNGIRIAGRKGWKPDWTVAKQVLALGVPAALEQILMSAAFLVLTILVARLGTDTLAAQRISITALSFSFLPGFGFSIAATALVGQSIGAGRPRDGEGVARVATVWAVAWMGTIGLLILLFAAPIMRLFTSNPEVVRIGAAALRVVALSQMPWAVGMVQTGALRGTGDTRYPLVLGATSIWSAVLLAWIVVRLGGELPAIWAVFLVTSPTSAYLAWRRLRRRLQEFGAD